MKKIIVITFLFLPTIYCADCSAMPTFTPNAALSLSGVPNEVTFTSNGSGANQKDEWLCNSMEGTYSAISIDVGYLETSLKAANICVIEYP